MMGHKLRGELTPKELENVRQKDKLRPNRNRRAAQLTDNEREHRNTLARNNYHKRRNKLPKKLKLTSDEKLIRAREYDRKRYLRDKDKRLAACKQYRTSEAGQRSKRKATIKKYGLSVESYFQLLDAQGRLCAICGTGIAGKRIQWFSVDHCHKTGKIRGLLCQQCNSYLGHIDDRIAAAHRLVEYLERGN